ncbi:MAG TPA: tetratricopeptide repeat protein [Blastocatellia bacterium]|nr:tetratricopeptide repeat protein [Blastocatellia bacterium]
MLKLILLLTLLVPSTGPLPKEQTQQPKPAQTGAGFIAPSEANVRISPDVRTFVVMAALNIAGFDYESGGQALSPARVELRKDLAKLDPQIKEKLASFYQAHRRPGVDETSDAARYAALSLLMTEPPGFTVYQSSDRPLPADLQTIVDFVPLVREFYIKSGIRELVPKYMGVGEAYATALRGPVGMVIYDVLDYFHTRPETVISMRPLVVKTGEAEGKTEKTTVVSRSRTRQVFVVPDPLAPRDTAIVRGDILNQKEDILARRVGDDYIVIIGPARSPSADSVRQAMIRFVIDPMVERHLKTSLEFKDPISKLVAGVPTASKEYTNSVYLVIRESLAQATEARLRRINSIASKGAYTEDYAVFDLAQAYLRGAVLSFHFYESLSGFEKVGIGIEDFFDHMVANAKFDREAVRSKEFEPIVARVSASRSKLSRPNNDSEGAAAEAVMGAMGAKVLKSDDLIRQKKFGEARAILDEVLGVEPNNARALYGMAQVVTQMASAAELDPKTDENDKIQMQHDRLERAIKLYRRAIENASKDSERWLIQWSHVLLGRILDFQEFRADALSEYEKAIAMGELPNGAYKEALEGKQRPYGNK